MNGTMGDWLEIDARGLKCPLPVLKAEKALDAMTGQIALEIIADDPIARIDIPLLCQKRGLNCEIFREQTALRFRISGGAKSSPA